MNPTYAAFRQSMHAELAPAGPLQTCLADEIANAAWQLRICAAAEADLGDYIPDDPTRRSIERTRAASHTVLHRSINQLRRLQAERVAPDEIPAVVEPLADPIPTATQPQIARNALCPCHSGEKYKRCCGRNAPPILYVSSHANSRHPRGDLNA